VNHTKPESIREAKENEMKRYLVLSMFLISLMGHAFAQWDRPTTSFHVTEVQSKQQVPDADVCKPSQCAAYLITVKGYTEAKNSIIKYVLECYEVIQFHPEKTHLNNLACFHVHAGNVYPGYVNPTSISFWAKENIGSAKGVAGAYDIKSETEVSKGEK
jgi:hypothetical protein